MRRWATWLLGASIALAALGAGLALHQQRAARRAAQSDLATLEATALPGINGRLTRLDAWQGQVQVINFWATWCAPCREEIPAFSAVARSLAGRGVAFVGIAIDTDANVADFLHQTPVAYPVLIAGMAGGQLSELAGNRSGAVPYTLVIDRNGTVRARHAGRMQAAELRRILAPLVAAAGS